jgi:hypothetical protein
MSASSLPDLGTDIRALDDLPPQMNLQSGLPNLGEAIARRLQTPRGGLFYAPNYGTDVRSWLNEAMTDDDIFRAKVSIEAECEKDERVLAADATLALNQPSQTLTISLELILASGPFQLVLSVNQVSVAILEAS